MFWSSPSRAVNIIVFTSFVSLAISFFVYSKTKNRVLAIFLLSLLSFLSLYLNIDSELFSIYNLKWVVVFTLDYWPWINLGLLVLLIINFIKNKNAKTQENR